MRLVTWYCQLGTIEDRLRCLSKLDPDMVALQEVREPERDADRQCWRGRYRTKGQAVRVVERGWTGHALQLPADTPLSVLSVEVTAPASLRVVGVWTQRTPTYVDHSLRGLAAIRPLLLDKMVILLGDFNSAPKVNQRAHKRLVDTLAAQYGMVSAYHQKLGLDHGDEKHPTYYHRRNPEDRWHFDFCFVPQKWTGLIEEVKVGTFEDWPDSDHRPLSVELNLH